MRHIGGVRYYKNQECSLPADNGGEGEERSLAFMRRWVRAAGYGWEFLGRACAVGR